MRGFFPFAEKRFEFGQPIVDQPAIVIFLWQSERLTFDPRVGIDIAQSAAQS